MATWPDPRSISVGFAFGHNQYEDPAGLTYTTVSPFDDADAGDDPGPVKDSVLIKRGRIGDAPETQPASVDLVMADEDGEFSPRNVEGPHYGQLRKGTPGQVAVDFGSGPVVLARGGSGDWSPTWTGPEIDEKVRVQLLGLLDRISTDTTVSSRLRLAITRNADDFTHYWHFEDGASRFASGLSGGAPLMCEGVDFASDATLLGSTALPVFSATSNLVVPFAASALNGAWAWSFFIKYPAAPTGTVTLADIAVTGGTLARVVVTANTTTLTVSAYNAAGTLLDDDTSTNAFGVLFSGGWVKVDISATTSGADVNVDVRRAGATSGFGLIATSGGMTVGYPVTGVLPATAVFTGASVGHMTLRPDVSFPWSPGDEIGGADESARNRVVRLALLAGIPKSVPVGPDSPNMGTREPQTLYRELRDCEDADGGVLYELRNGRLTFQPIGGLLNASVALTLAFGTGLGDGEISDLVPLDDTRDVYNMVTVATPDGAFGYVEETDGPLGSDTSTGIGPRPVLVTRNLATAVIDATLNGLSGGQIVTPGIHAGWILRRATIDKPRFVIAIDLYANPDLAADVIACDLGSRIRVTGAPAKHVGPDTLDLILVGEQIELEATRFMVTWWLEPYEPFRVQQLADTSNSDLLDGWLIPDSCSLAVDVDDNDTSWSVDIDPLMTTDSDDFPCRVSVEGEEVWVTVCAGASSPQTWTVTRSVNGVVKDHSAGAEIVLLDPLVLSL